MTDGADIVLWALGGLALAWTVNSLWLRVRPDTKTHRLVTEQDGTEHVSHARYTEDDANMMLALEAQLHRGTGWTVDTYENGMLRCAKGQTVRWLWIRP